MGEECHDSLGLRHPHGGGSGIFAQAQERSCVGVLPSKTRRRRLLTLALPLALALGGRRFGGAEGAFTGACSQSSWQLARHRRSSPITRYSVEEFSNSTDETLARFAAIAKAIDKGKAKGETPSALLGSEEELLDLLQPWMQASLEEERDNTGVANLDEFLARDLADRARAMQVEPQTQPEPEDDATLLRMNRTLEFCPDGILARKLLGEMLAEGEVPSAAAYDVVLEALDKTGNLDDALELFREMQVDARVLATERTFNALARPASRIGDWRFVERLYKAKASLGPTSLAILLDSYANGLPRQPSRAEETFMEHIEDEDARRYHAEHPEVFAALRRAVGSERFESLCTRLRLGAAEEQEEG